MSDYVFKRGDGVYPNDLVSKQPVSKPIDVSQMLTRWIAKYDVTLFGATEAELDSKQAEMEAKRKGQRIVGMGKIAQTHNEKIKARAKSHAMTINPGRVG